MGLIVFVQNAGLGITAHSRGSHFVDAEPRPSHFRINADIGGAGGREHLRSLNGNVLRHDAFVLSPVAVNLESGNTPGVELILVDLNIIVVIRQAFAETAKSHAPLAGVAQRILEVHAKSGSRHSALPTVSATTALIAIAAEEISLLGFHVAESRNVNTVGTIAKWHFVFMAGHGAGSAAAHVVIHQVVAKFAAAVGKAVGKFGRRRMQQDARVFERSGAEKDDAAMKLQRFLALAIDHADAGNTARRGIENQAVNHAVRTNRKLAGLHRSGKRGIQAAEIRLRDAAAVTNAAVVACGAAFVHTSEHGGAANGEDAVVECFCQRIPEVLLDAS